MLSHIGAPALIDTHVIAGFNQLSKKLNERNIKIGELNITGYCQGLSVNYSFYGVEGRQTFLGYLDFFSKIYNLKNQNNESDLNEIVDQLAKNTIIYTLEDQSKIYINIDGLKQFRHDLESVFLN